MAKFIPDNAQELLKQIAQLKSDSEAVCDKMLEAGGEVAFNAIKAKIPTHWDVAKKSKTLTKVKKRKKTGDKYIRVIFKGYDRTKISKSYPKGVPNSLKVAVYEYGKPNQPARPFIRPAMQSAETEITAAMQNVYDEEVKKVAY